MRFSMLRLLNVTGVSQTLKRLKTEAPLFWESFKKTNKDVLTKKVTGLNDWYTKLLHLDEVKMYQDRVVALQERLLQAQDKRREVGRLLAETRKKSNQLQDEIHKVKRQEDIERFLTLMKEETEVLRMEHEISRTFHECDQAERELFAAFTNAVRDSHEKQRAQLEYTKYFGIILSIAGSFLAFCYTTLRKDDLKRFIEDSLSKSATVQTVNSENNSDTNTTNSRNSNENLESLINVVKSETVRLSEMINFNQHQVTCLIEKDEAKKKQLIYYMGVSVLLLILFKAMSTN